MEECRRVPCVLLLLLLAHWVTGLSGIERHRGLPTTYLNDAISTETPPSRSPVPRMPGALVTNLTVNAKVHNVTRHTLQLFVSWISPKKDNLPGGYQFPDRYSLLVKLLDVSDSYCSSNSLHIEHISIDDPRTQNITFPVTVSVVHGRDMRIRPQCTYQVIVESYPFDSKQVATVNYTVPDCVEQICWCPQPSTTPMASHLSYEKLQNNDYNITWKLNTKDYNITKVYLCLADFNSHHSVIKFTIKEEIDANHILSLHQTKVISSDQLQPGHSYKVKVVVIDIRGCKWQAGNLTLNINEHGPSEKPEDSKDKSEVMIVVVLPVLLFMVIVCLAIFILWQRCKDWMRCKFGASQLQPIHSWRGVYKAVSMERRVSRNFPALQERNIIYVEKEIEDAKARGDADSYEVSYTRLDLGRQIGKGAFGRVFLARAEAIANVPGFMTVAAKKLKNHASTDEMEEFLSEIAMMKHVGQHPNIVTMLGCCTLQEPFCMLMEYVPCGDLLQYLRHLRFEYEQHMGGTLPFISTMERPVPTVTPRYVDLLMGPDSDSSYVQPDTQHSTASSGRPSITETEWSILSSEGVSLTPTEITPPHKLECILDPKELQSFAVQIARGMAHLEHRNITHRDLAARNVLIDEHKTLKISDFGLSRSGIYVNTKRKKVPLRWLSVEAMRDNLYSSKSDVWAFAIVLWEIGTLGGFPYPTVADMNLLTFLLSGKRLEKPDNCSDELYSIMLKCWSHSADTRPTFAELVSHLDSVICEKRVYINFDHLSSSYTFPPMEQQDLTNTSEHKPIEF